MDILQHNLSWMLLNSWLAILPVLFLQLSITLKQKMLKLFFLLLWFFFIPNTLYVITDMMHLFEQWSYLHGVEKVVLIAQFSTLEACGFLTFLLGLSPFEKIVRRSQWKRYTTKILIGLNFLIGFAIVLGKIDRVNSWEIVTNPIHFVNSSIHVVTFLPLLCLTLLFGCFANLVYFSAKETHLIQ